MGGTGTNTGYSDADYNWLGGSWSDSTVQVRTQLRFLQPVMEC